MCGIIGYTGAENCVSIITDSLKKLEYRGYDSMGMAIYDGKNINVTKTAGKFEKFEEAIQNKPGLSGKCAIGHTRWATNGKPEVKNAHPHEGNRFVMVHNGIIENCNDLKKEFFSGEIFKSDTDTEVALRLLELFIKTSNNVSSAIRMLFDTLEGSYAFCIMDKENPDVIYAVKNKSPLLIGSGVGFNMVGSDANALIDKTNVFYDLKDMEYAIISEGSVEIYCKSGKKIIRQPFFAESGECDSEKGMYPHFMLKEIEEQPDIIKRNLKAFADGNVGLRFDPILISEMKKCDRIYIVACGTSYHCALLAKHWFENVSGKGAEAVMAGEFKSLGIWLEPNPFFVFISQSGETADCLSALSIVKKQHHPTLAVTNSKLSGLARDTDFALLINAGPEISVASTKAYTAQSVVMYLLSNAISDRNTTDVYAELEALADAVGFVCQNKKQIKKIASEWLGGMGAAFYMGKGADYYVSLEAALKLKEISYIHTVGIAASELKHGTLALIDEKAAVIAFVTQAECAENIRSNINEVDSRGAKVCVISSKSLCCEDDSFTFPDVSKNLSPLVAAVCSQYIAYYAALDRGLDIDRPRNLAKSVTVE